MRLLSKTVLTVSAFLTLGVLQNVSESQASVFLWESEDRSVSVTFPDRWQRIHNQRSSDILTVKAPGDYDYATCAISARQDERFKIFPVHFSPDIQKQYYSRAMWENHFDGQSDTVFHRVIDGAGLGNGFASMASVSYETSTGPKMMKRALAFASLYGNTLYSVECSAEASAYDRLHNSFMSFVKSVDFKRTTNHALSGYYRNFIQDSEIKIKGATLLDDTYH